MQLKPSRICVAPSNRLRDAVAVLPSVIIQNVGAPIYPTFAAQYWACMLPDDASPPPSRTTMHGFGSMWIATPSSSRTLTSYSLPAPGARLFESAHRLGGRLPTAPGWPLLTPPEATRAVLAVHLRARTRTLQFYT
jgi:hypothetical protein